MFSLLLDVDLDAVDIIILPFSAVKRRHVIYRLSFRKRFAELYYGENQKCFRARLFFISFAVP